MTPVLVVACSIVGLVVGWLLDPVITRVPRKVPVSGPATDDLPPSSATRRVVVSVLMGALFGATAARFEDSWLLPAYLVLTAGLVVLAVIDLETFLLPNRIVYPLGFATTALLALGTLVDGSFDAFVRGLLAGAIAFVFFYVLYFISPRSMGFGDVRLSFVLGLALGVLGWGEVVIGLFLALAYCGVLGVFLIAIKVRARNEPIPFGPFLVGGAMTAILVGAPIVDWYLGR